MIGKGKSETKIATLPEVLDILNDRKKEGETGYEQQLTDEYAKKFSKVSVGDAKKMMKELEELGLGEKASAKVIEIMPNDLVMLKQVLIIEKKSLEEETVGKVLAVVNSYKAK
jgi:DNA-directed RNA polymerase subunit F